MTERRRLIELALVGLEHEQTRIQQEITALRSELGHAAPRAGVITATGRVSPNKGKTMSMAQRRKISLAMKRRWAAHRKSAA
jgi:hypothetical protein